MTREHIRRRPFYFFSKHSKPKPAQGHEVSMEPISLASAVDILGGLLQTIFKCVEAFDRLDRLPSEYKGIAQEHKQALISLRADVCRASEIFNAIIRNGDDGVVNALLSSEEGDSTYKRITQESDKLKTNILQQIRATDSIISNVNTTAIKGRRVNVFINIVGGKDVLAQLTTNLRHTLHALEKSRDNLLVESQHFNSLYQLERKKHVPLEPTQHHHRALHRCCSFPTADRFPHEPEVLTQGALFHGLKHAFRDRPFQLRLDSSKLQDMSVLRTALTSSGSEDWEDKLVQLMREEGVRWVKETLRAARPNDTIPSYNQTYNKLLSSSMSCVSSLRDTLSSADGRAKSERIEQLENFSYDLTQLMRRSETTKVSVAFCGMVKAGKSLLLNALIGQVLLPTDELPSTAWPCRVQHLKGQSIPTLEVNVAPFQEVVKRLREEGFDAKMANFEPPQQSETTRNVFADFFNALLTDSFVASTEERPDPQLLSIYDIWNTLHPVTKKNLRKFEEEGFRLASYAEGMPEVKRLLGEINDIVRLCRAFNIPFRGNQTHWPTMKVEMDSLMAVNSTAGSSVSFEFIDIPGLGEGFKEFDFEEMVKTVTKSLDVIIPIISFKEVSRSDWRIIPRLVQESFSKAPDMVVCSHLDLYTRSEKELRSTVASTFWKADPSKTSSVLACSSRLGLSARLLLRKSRTSKPDFDEIMDPDAIESYCAEAVLGKGSPRRTYNSYTLEDWNSYVSEQFRLSGLQDTLARISTGIVEQALRRAYVKNSEDLLRPVGNAAAYQLRILNDRVRQSQQRLDARQKFENVKSTCDAILASWPSDVKRTNHSSTQRLQRLCDVLRATASGLAEKVVSDLVQQESRRVSDKQQLANINSNNLVFNSIDDVERLLHQTHENLKRMLTDIKVQFVRTARQCADTARKELVERLMKKLSAETIPATMRVELAADLTDDTVNINVLLMSSIKNKVLTKIKERHGAISAFQAIERSIANAARRKKPRLANGSEELREKEYSERDNALNELGFMIRAPVAMIAAIPWALGAGVWPFMKKKERYVIQVRQLTEMLNTQIVEPLVKDLCREAEDTLKGVVETTSSVGRASVESILKREEAAFSRLGQDGESSSTGMKVALESVSNLFALEGALESFRDCLKSSVPA